MAVDPAGAAGGAVRYAAAARAGVAGAWRRRLGSLPRAPRPFLPATCSTREVYPASEGFCAIADGGSGEGLRLLADRGVFWEFVPVGELGTAAPTRHWVATIETGVEYAVVVTSCAGLWSYVLGDTVRFISRAPPRLLVTGRTSYTLSAFGEHLSGEEIEAALLGAAESFGLAVAEYMVGPVFRDARGGHRWLVEPAATAPRAGATAGSRAGCVAGQPE
ncbi:GH3 auxin-responsive promoter family protein [Siccirubricoccus deserti]